jgi:hypothetical protein
MSSTMKTPEHIFAAYNLPEDVATEAAEAAAEAAQSTEAAEAAQSTEAAEAAQSTEAAEAAQ